MPTTVYSKADGQKFTSDFGTELVTVACAACGIVYAIPGKLYRSAQMYKGDKPGGWDLCCPLGHTWHYCGPTDEEKLRERLERERSRAGRLASQLDQARAGERGQRAAKTRFKNERDRLKTRTAHGVCPCCNRTFKQLAQHMSAKHPEFPAHPAERHD